jgi:hypothetical protein
MNSDNEGGSQMFTKTRQVVAALSFAGALVVGTAVTSGQTTVGDGLITVAIGDVTITDVVDIGVAAQVAANVCGVKVGPVAVLGRAVDRTGQSRTVCTTDQGPVTLVNN